MTTEEQTAILDKLNSGVRMMCAWQSITNAMAPLKQFERERIVRALTLLVEAVGRNEERGGQLLGPETTNAIINALEGR